MDNFKKFMLDNFGWLLAVLRSRKFWVLLLSVMGSYGVDITPELRALIMLVAGIVFAATTAWEDAAQKGAAVEVVWETPGIEMDVEDTATPVQ